MIRNNKPFDILLDMYSTECFNLYGVVRSFTNYPSIVQEHDDSDPDGKLYATAFAKLCSAFLSSNAGMYPHEDSECYYEDLGFSEDLDYLKELAVRNNIQPDTDHTFLFDSLIERYVEKIKLDLARHFPKEENRFNFFMSVFYMNISEPDYIPPGYPNMSFLQLSRK